MKTRHLAARWRVFVAGARTTGFVRAVSMRVGRLLRDGVVWIACLPVTCVLHLLGFRRITFLTGRIGHLAAEVDSFLKARALGDVPPGRYFAVAPRGAVANPHLLHYWRPHVRVITQPVAAVVLAAMSRWLLMRYDAARYVQRLGVSQELYSLNARWPPRPPLLRLSADDAAWGDIALRQLGLPPGAWFVAVHVREPGFSPADDSQHTHRNADPAAMIPAMRAIADRGGWCVRLGDATQTPLPPMPHVIDYALHPMRSDRLDIVLCARARCFLGNTSGLAFVSTAFGVPSALVNMIPTATLAPLPGDLSIPKLLYSRAERRPLRFPEVFASPLSDFRFAGLYEAAGVDPIDNTPEEILELTTEMLDRLDGRVPGDEDDRELQRRYRALFRPGHYSYGAASGIGQAFLRRHRHLLDTCPQ